MLKRQKITSPKPQQLLERGILNKWHDKTFDSFTGDPDVLKSLKKYVKNSNKARKDGIGLFMYGPYGVGKTLLANVILKELLAQGYTVRMITLSTLVTMFTGSWYSDEVRNEFLEITRQVDFLGIDDLGKEFKGSTDLGVKVFDNIVRYRLQSNLPIIFTANISPKELSDYYSASTSSMLNEMCAVVQVTGDDHRSSFRERNRSIIGK